LYLYKYYNLKLNLKTKTMSQTKTKTVKPLYPVSRLTKNSNSKLWVAFPVNRETKGLVYSSTLTRDQVRRNVATVMGISKDDVRSVTVRTYRRRSK
jgi:hypothetical protein